MKNIRNESQRETQTVPCSFSRSQDKETINLVPNFLGLLGVSAGILGTLGTSTGGLLGASTVLGPVGAALGAAYFLSKKIGEVEKEEYSNENRKSSIEEDEYYFQLNKQRKLIQSTNKYHEDQVVEAQNLPSTISIQNSPSDKLAISTSDSPQKPEINLVQPACDDDSVPASIQEEKNNLVSEEDIIYNTLYTPELFEQYKPEKLYKAFEALYKQGNNTFFQCTPQEFRYWLGGTMGKDFKADEVGCRRIKWKKGKYALQYFMVKLYLVKRKRMPRNMWDKIANVFVIDNLPIRPRELGKNVDKVGKEDKQKIDEMIKQFNKEMKKA